MDDLTKLDPRRFQDSELIRMRREALDRGFHVLVLTNAVQPMQRLTVVNLNEEDQ